MRGGFKTYIKVSWKWELRKHIPRGNSPCKGAAMDT